MLREKLLDPGAGVLLYGTTPPRTGTGEELLSDPHVKKAYLGH